MSKNSHQIIPVFHADQSVYREDPAFLATREDCRAMKKAGEGYFLSNGSVFKLLPKAEANWEELAKRYDFRDESACIQEPTMFAYVLGERRAIAAVESWR